MALSKYMEKALEIVMQDETDKWINKLEKGESATKLAYMYGYEKGCIEKDIEQEEISVRLDKIDTKVIIKTIENMSHLTEFLKNDNNSLVKSKLIQDIIDLNQYVSEVLLGNDNN